MLAMGALAFAMHALLVSPPAQALTSDESNFVAAVEADGVSGIDAQTMVDNGYRICNDLNTGLTPAQASDQTTVLNPSVSLVQSFGMTGTHSGICARRHSSVTGLITRRRLTAPQRHRTTSTDSQRFSAHWRLTP